MIRLSFINSLEGDTKHKIYVENPANPQERDDMASEVTRLMKKGYALFVKHKGEDYLAKDYDQTTHQWVVVTEKRVPEKVAADGTEVTAVAPSSGG